ncbi:MAG: WbqC-like protein family protein [uncultured bacterium]|nr:MAG: WbqC-like protein family protein [uncultured bacterium]
MILSAHQPAYLPWLGYFDKMFKSDIFIYLDSVQYEKNSFTNRNKIKTPQGEMWLTVPILTKGHIDKILIEMEIDNRQNWSKKHLNSIYMNYKKASYFEDLYPKLETLYKEEYGLLSDLCYNHLLFWLKELGIEKRIIKSSELDIQSKKSNLVLDLCKQFNANHYISGALGQNYISEESFRNNGIILDYQDYKHPIYNQLWGNFLPYMSILDFCMNTKEYYLITGEN